MYKLHLILKYLRKRRIAWVSLIAVMLCTAMVLVVISVMGGWLRMFRETNHALIGDLIVYRGSLDGFAHYDEMVQEISQVPEVKAAAPTVHTYGLINVADQIRKDVEVVGLQLPQMEPVNGFVKSLHLQPQVLLDQASEAEQSAATLRNVAATRPMEASDLQAEADALSAKAAFLRGKAESFPSWEKFLPADVYRNELPNSKADVAKWPGMIMGAGVINLPKDSNRDEYLYRAWVRLTVLDMSGNVDVLQDSTAIRSYWIIDDSRTGVFQIDQNTIYVPFDLLQKDLKMDAQEYTDRVTGLKQVLPARANQIAISLKEGFSPDLVKPKIQLVVDKISRKYGMDSAMDPITAETWEEQQADFLSAVEHEKVLLVILFSIISVVAVFLIFCIFFMVVVEKTRDIGIIKSVGATGAGVAVIFLGYGFVIGIVGGGMGLLLGYLVVHNINWLHEWLGRHMGIKIWDAKTYLFDTIPNTMETRDVVVIVTVAVLSSVAGAIVPAVRAARMNPVEALRWE